MSAQKSFNQVISVFQTISQQLENINSFGVGERYDVNTNRNTVYPLMWVQPIQSYFSLNELHLKFNIYILDLVQKDKSNLNDVMSDTLQTALFVKSILKNNPCNDFTIQEDGTLEPFMDWELDEVAGWAIQTDVTIWNTDSLCDIPGFSPCDSGPNTVINVSTGALPCSAFNCITANTIYTTILSATTIFSGTTNIYDTIYNIVNDLTDNYWTAGTATNAIRMITLADNNISNGNYSIVAGAANSIASGDYGMIGGGTNNSMTSANCTAIPGGALNFASNASYGVIGGGLQNYISANKAIVVGGKNNRAYALYSFVGGGNNNYTFGKYASVLNGYKNKAVGYNSQVLNGYKNRTDNKYGQILNGKLNHVYSDYSTIGNGYNNNILAGGSVYNNFSTILNGNGNTIRAGVTPYTCNYSTILGGKDNTIHGASYGVVWGKNNTLQTGAIYSNILGGASNVVSGTTNGLVCTLSNLINGSNNNTILGGNSNTINVNASSNTLLGAIHSDIGSSSQYNMLAACKNSTILSSTTFSVIIGGQSNKIFDGINYAFVFGSFNSAQTNSNITIAGGTGHTASGKFSYIGQGQNNIISSTSTGSTVLNGRNNTVNGDLSVILNGFNSTVSANNSAIISASASTLTQDNTLLIQRFRHTGGQQNKYREVTVSGITSVALDDYMLGCDTTGGQITVSLPNSPIQGQTYWIKDIRGVVDVYNIILNAGLNQFEGAVSTTSMTKQFASAIITWTGTKWIIWKNSAI